jgi:hypothetical protein
MARQALAPVSEALLDLAAPCAGERVLDVGCGASKRSKRVLPSRMRRLLSTAWRATGFAEAVSASVCCPRHSGPCDRPSWNRFRPAAAHLSLRAPSAPPAAWRRLISPGPMLPER